MKERIFEGIYSSKIFENKVDVYKGKRK